MCGWVSYLGRHIKCRAVTCTASTTHIYIAKLYPSVSPTGAVDAIPTPYPIIASVAAITSKLPAKIKLFMPFIIFRPCNLVSTQYAGRNDTIPKAYKDVYK